MVQIVCVPWLIAVARAHVVETNRDCTRVAGDATDGGTPYGHGLGDRHWLGGAAWLPTTFLILLTLVNTLLLSCNLGRILGRILAVAMVRMVVPMVLLIVAAVLLGTLSDRRQHDLCTVLVPVPVEQQVDVHAAALGAHDVHAGVDRTDVSLCAHDRLLPTEVQLWRHGSTAPMCKAVQHDAHGRTSTTTTAALEAQLGCVEGLLHSTRVGRCRVADIADMIMTQATITTSRSTTKHATGWLIAGRQSPASAMCGPTSSPQFLPANP